MTIGSPSTQPPGPTVEAKGLAKSCDRMRHGPKPKFVDASPSEPEGGYSPMTARTLEIAPAGRKI
jgi:hypothetical protein